MLTNGAFSVIVSFALCLPAAVINSKQPVNYSQDLPETIDFGEQAAFGQDTQGAVGEEREAAISKALQQKKSGDQQGALATLLDALKILPHDTTLLKDLAVQALQMKRYEIADSAAREARTLAPGDLETLYALARIELEEDFYSKSRKDFQDYLAARPKDASAHYGFGHLLQRNLDVDGAKVEFKRSIELQPQQTESYYQLGQIALDAHENSEAESFFRTVLTRAPEHGGALAGLGILSYRAHKFGEAEPLLEHAISSTPEYQPAHYYLGLCLYRLNKTQQADEQLSLATDLAGKQQGKSSPLPPVH